MRVVVRIAGLAAAAALVLWCAVIAIRSFTPQAGAGLPRLDGGGGLQLLLGLAAVISAALVAGAAFALGRPSGRFGQPLWLVVGLLGWAALSATVAAHTADLLLTPVDDEMGVGPGVMSSVAPAWETWFWVVAAGCAALAGGVLIRWALQERGASRAPDPTA
jgi:hypothetical protein